MLKAVSYLAPSWFKFYQSVTDALARSLSQEIQLQAGDCDPLEDPLLLQDQLDLAFICGLPFIRHHKANPQQLQVLAVPVLQAERYGNRPIYFADVIVNAVNPITEFSELAGKVFCYNDRGSNSGYNLVRSHLLHHGYGKDFFGTCLESGSHQRSLQWIIEGKADWATLDSTVLEQLGKEHPDGLNQIKVIASLGPSPMPPIVVSSHLNADWIEKMRSALFHPDPALKAVMESFGVARYEVQTWQDYEVLAGIYGAVTEFFDAESSIKPH